MEKESIKKPAKSKIVLAVIIIVTALTAIFAAGCLFGTGDDSSSSGSEGSTANTKLEISGVEMTTSYNQMLGYTAEITGTAKNATNKNYSYASVEFSVYDAEGTNLGTALANINNLGSGETWKFKATLLEFPDTEPKTFKLVEIIAW